MEGFLFAMDIVKAFDSLDHNFLIPTPAKYGFDKYFILSVKILLRDQELCVTCGGTTKRSGVVCYLRRYNYKIFLIWERRPSRWPNFSFLFILALETLSLLIKSKPEIEGIQSLIIATFILHMLMMGVMKGVQVAVCGMRCIDLNNNMLKILDTQFSYNEKLKEEKKFCKVVTDIQRVLKIWKMR